jgi:hypothetical protein
MSARNLKAGLQEGSPSAQSPIVGELFPITDLPHRGWMPRKKRGKTLSKFTILRWCLHGRGGIRMRSVMVGGLRCTTDLWAQQFFTRLSDTAGEQKVPGPHDHDRAMAELSAAGIN